MGIWKKKIEWPGENEWIDILCHKVDKLIYYI